MEPASALLWTVVVGAFTVAWTAAILYPLAVADLSPWLGFDFSAYGALAVILKAEPNRIDELPELGR